jgi:hypothetical protein
MENKEYKWIRIVVNTELTKPKAKTKVYDVKNKETTFQLARIGWYGPFRKYSIVFSPNGVFEEECLRDILSFLEEIEKERKADIVVVGKTVKAINSNSK